MDALSARGIQLSPLKGFNHKLEVRAVKHEHLRGRNNVTSCRSPTRGFDTKLIKNNLKEKRQLEFLRRRSVSPEPSSARSPKQRKSSPKTSSMTSFHPSSRSGTFHTNVQDTTNGRSMMVLVPNSGAWSGQVTLMRQEKGHAKRPESTATEMTTEPNWTKNTDKRREHAPRTSVKSFFQTEGISQGFSAQTGEIHQHRVMTDAAVQTERGLINVKESDVQQLADYLQEALWREEAVRKKLAALQESTSNLANSRDKIWTTHCSEDLLRNKIKALEVQLQVCLQKFPKDGVKKLVLQMEKQKLVYEEKALVALQRATMEKSEALSKAEGLQGALLAAKADALRWQSLYEELQLSSRQLREHQHLSDEQLQQLHSQVELSGARQAALSEAVASLRRERNELQSRVCLLEDDNQLLREEIQHLSDGSNESQDIMAEDADARPVVARDCQAEEQLRHTQEKLRLKEKECEELQTELQIMEQECKSSQSRLSQCREELRRLSHHCRRPAAGVSWWRVCVILLLLLAVTGAAMLWMWHPPFREQVEDFYSDIETRIEDYLLQMASPQHSGCFRPV